MRWIKVEATIVECFRARDEPPGAARPYFEIVADIRTAVDQVERVTSHQRLHTSTHRWRPPDPGEVVPARWDPVHRKLRLDLRGQPRYDEKVIKKLERTRQAPTYPPTRFSGIG